MRRKQPAASSWRCMMQINLTNAASSKWWCHNAAVQDCDCSVEARPLIECQATRKRQQKKEKPDLRRYVSRSIVEVVLCMMCAHDTDDPTSDVEASTERYVSWRVESPKQSIIISEEEHGFRTDWKSSRCIEASSDRRMIWRRVETPEEKRQQLVRSCAKVLSREIGIILTMKWRH